MEGIKKKARKCASKLYGKFKWWYLEDKIDAYVISFPKAGRTWVRVFLAKYASLKFDIPISLDFFHVMQRKSEPRIYFTHTDVYGGTEEDIVTAVERFKGKKVIFLSRHPCDVVVSLYYEIKNRSDFTDEARKKVQDESTLKDFIRHPQFGLDRVVLFMNTYIESKELFESFLLVSYESLKEDSSTFVKVIDATGLGPVDEKMFNEAVEYSSFSNMRKIEKNNELNDWRVQRRDKDDPNTGKVRRGKVFGYIDDFDKDDIEYAKKVLSKLDARFEYAV